MKTAIRELIGIPAGIVAGRIIFGLSKAYCGNGFFTSFGTATLAIGAFAFGHTIAATVVDAFDTMNKDGEEEDENG